VYPPPRLAADANRLLEIGNRTLAADLAHHPGNSSIDISALQPRVDAKCLIAIGDRPLEIFAFQPIRPPGAIGVGQGRIEANALIDVNKHSIVLFLDAPTVA
jgi:hypothetical protein